MAKLGMERLKDVEMMTLSEFHYKRYAQEYKEIEQEYYMHKTAFLIRNAASTKNTGTEKNPKEEYVFKEFKDFFDYERALTHIDKVLHPQKKDQREVEQSRLSPAQIALKHNSRKG